MSFLSTRRSRASSLQHNLHELGGVQHQIIAILDYGQAR
jgi:hypothetical protein